MADERTSALANKLHSALAASYYDPDIRGTLDTLDARGLENTPETRRGLRLRVQREVLENDGQIVRDFGMVAAVSAPTGLVLPAADSPC